MNAARSMCRLAATAVAALVVGATAYAYSDAAVKDAEETLERTRVRYSFGEVLDADVALARYNLSEMKYRAGQIVEAAFCRSAEPDLQIIANGFEEQDGQAGEKRTWLDQIAAMQASPAKCTIAIATAARLLFGETDHLYSDEAVNQAEERVKNAEQQYTAGEVTEVDVAQARYNLLESRYGAKQMSRETYCRLGSPMLLNIAQPVEQESRVGQRTLEEVIAAKRALFKLQAFCQKH